MKSLLEPFAICLAILWCLAAMCTPEYTPPVTVQTPDGGEGLNGIPGHKTLEITQKDGRANQIPPGNEIAKVDPIPPMQAELPAAMEPARGSVAVFENHFFNAGVDDSRLCHVCGESIYHANHKWQDPKDIVCTNDKCTCKQCGSHCGWDCRCGYEAVAPTVKQSLTVQPTYRQPVYYQQRRGIFGGRFRRW